MLLCVAEAVFITTVFSKVKEKQMSNIFLNVISSVKSVCIYCTSFIEPSVVKGGVISILYPLYIT